MKRRSVRIGLAAGALVAVVLAALWLCGVFAPAVELPAPSQALIEARDGLDAVLIEASLDTEASELTVSQTLTLKNRTGQAQEAAVLRTWPNAFQSPDTSPAAAEEALYEGCYPDGFSIGALVMSGARVARVGGESKAVAYRYTDDAKTVLSVPITDGWQAEEWIEITLTYTVQIPHMAYRFGEDSGIWALGNAFAIPAVWEEGAWRTDEYAPVGDPFLSDCMNWTVSVSVPEGFLCAGSGYPTAETADGRTCYDFVSPAMRDFALVVSDRFHTAQAEQDGVLVSAYATDASRARELLDYGKQALACFSARYGAYPYQSYTLCEINFPMGGMEYPAMAMIAADLLDAGGESLETVVAHEVAHQWWYAVVGSDPVNQAWQDEALSQFSMLEYLEDRHGLARREEYEQRELESALRVTVPRGVTPGAPLDRFSSMSEYALVVYDRGAAMFCALDRMLDGGLDDFLRAYYERYAFGRATREDFESLLAETTGEDLTPLIRDYLDTYILN